MGIRKEEKRKGWPWSAGTVLMHIGGGE